VIHNARVGWPTKNPADLSVAGLANRWSVLLDWPLLPSGLVNDAAVTDAHLDRINDGHDETARREVRQIASGFNRRCHFDPAQRVAETNGGVKTAMDPSHE
jgi:hypothetical protein